MRREFRREAPDELWMTDITEHPTREGKIYCCVVLDAFSRRVVGWSIDSTQTTLLVTNALGMATRRRDPAGGLVIHTDHGVQFTSWAFSQKVRDAGLAPSIGAIGCPYDNAVIEAFWGRMPVELLNRKSWKTRIELASAIHDYIELFHNSRRRHSVLGMLTPTEYVERTSAPTTPPDSRTRTPENRGQITVSTEAGQFQFDSERCVKVRHPALPRPTGRDAVGPRSDPADARAGG